MPTAATKNLLSPDEYLTGEEQADTRHEYVTGNVYAMAGLQGNPKPEILSIDLS